MDAKALAFFEQLIETPSPSGYEQPVQQLVREYLQPLTEHIRTDLHGNVIACIHPDAEVRVLLDGHCDQIGLLVTHIDERGFVYAQPIGGWDPQQLVGQRMAIWAKDGPVPAVISRKPIHLLTDEERKQVVRTEQLWLDLGVPDKEAAQHLVSIGDPVTLELGMCRLQNNLVSGPKMDNTTGLWVVLEAFRRAAAYGVACALHVVSSVQEEIGLRGAHTATFGVDPHIGVAVDVTHATDCPTIDMNQRGDLRLGEGPIIFRGPNMNPRVVERLRGAANDHGIPTQIAAFGRGMPNDANAIQLSRSGVATGLVSIPNRYMHSAVETISLDDIDHAAELLARFVCTIDAADDFIP